MTKFLLFLYFFLLSVFVFLSSGAIDSQDGFQYVGVARNIYYKGWPSAPPNEYDTRQNIHLTTYPGKDGNYYSQTGLGFSLAYVPAVALTDVFYKIYGISPPEHFPLESDWLILLFAGFTNSFFGALLGLILFLYFIELKLSPGKSFLMVIVSLFATNLLVYTKHAFAHMMLITFIFTSFYFLKKYSASFKNKLLFLSGLSLGVASISYNLSWIFIIPSLMLYAFLLFHNSFQKQPWNLSSFWKSAKKLFSKKSDVIIRFGIFFLGFLPFLIINVWFEQVRAAFLEDGSSTYFYSNYFSKLLSSFKPSVIFEGLYGQLFSPGRSIFIYSPVLLLIIIFWTKIKRFVIPELIVFFLTALIFILFYSNQFSQGNASQGIAGLWHGESSWGPRYLAILIPFGMLITGVVFWSLSKLQKLLFAVPLIIFGIYINFLGVIVPYQDKLHNMEENFYVNNTEYTSYAYINFLPRFSPLITMPKEFIKMLKTLPKTINHGPYNVHFRDGIDFPFKVGPERWRVIKNYGIIHFDNPPSSNVKKITLNIINHGITESSNAAILKVKINDQIMRETKILPGERLPVDINTENTGLKKQQNELLVETYYENPQVDKEKSQITALMSFSINGIPVNIESLEYPFVSPLGPAMTGTSYKVFGGLINDPWYFWEIHTQIYERIPDFWWIKLLYYWDIPRLPVIVALITNLTLILYFSLKLPLYLRSINKTS